MPRIPCPPLAYFLTWTCYGQRVHGDGRGAVDKLHNIRGTPRLAPDADREDFLRDAMRGETFTLTAEMSGIADKSIRVLCEEKEWACLAVNVRRTHAHVVVNCRGEVSPERALAAFKARITRDLRLEGQIAADSRIWTAHGSTRWINHAPGLYGAVSYVNEWQSRKKRAWLEAQKVRLREFLAEKRRERAEREGTRRPSRANSTHAADSTDA